MVAPDDAGKWDGTIYYLFKITGESDKNWAKHQSKQSVKSGCTFLNNAMIKCLLN